MHAMRGAAVTAVALALGACAWGSRMGATAPEEPQEDRAPHAEASATRIVLDSMVLRGGDPNLLHLLRAHVPTMSVHTGARHCAEITLRGQQSVLESNDPVIYVDGTRAADTCVLEMLNVAEIELVEVYPQGVRSGYMTSPTGLIFITSRGADQ
jgi:TonB-dependent Receptor Plug Domain